MDLDRMIEAISFIGQVRKRQKRHPGASDGNWKFDQEIRQITASTMAIYEKDILAALKELRKLKGAGNGLESD